MDVNPYQTPEGREAEQQSQARRAWFGKAIFDVSCGLGGAILGGVLRAQLGIVDMVIGYMFIAAGILLGGLIAMRLSPLIFGIASQNGGK